MRPLVHIAVLAAALAAAGCTSGLLRSRAQPSQLYVLRAQPPAVRPPPARAAGSLRVLRPLSAPGLDGDRLALLESGNRLGFYAASRWGAPLPDVVEDLAVRVLRGTGAWATVADDRAPFNADLRLQLYIDHFEAVYPDGMDAASPGAIPVVNVGVHGVLVRNGDGVIEANLAATATRRADANRLGSVVAAFQAAANEALAAVAAQAAGAR